MAFELLPLLTDEGSPPLPGGEYVPPVASTSQEVADVTADYLDYLNPDLKPSSLAYMSFVGIDGLERLVRGIFSGIKAGGEWVGELGSSLGVDLGRTWRETHDFVDTIITGIGWEAGQPTVIERLEAIQAVGVNSWWGEVPFDPTDTWWELVGTSTFTDYIHFEEEGHVYIVDAIAPITSRSEEIIDGEVVYFGLGWWAEMAGDYRGQRGYLDFEKNLIHNRGHLMRGCMVNLPKGGDGQISAYKYTQ